MRVNVIGYGTVGKAQEFLLKKLGHEVLMSTYGASKFGHPFGGKCLPMCMDELITAFRGEGLNPLLFEAVKTYNLRIQNKHDDT